MIIPGKINSQDDVLQQVIGLPGQNSSIYSVLNQISGQTGYYFVYNTDVLDSDKKVRLKAADKTLLSWLEDVIDDPSLDYNIIENHILVFQRGDDAEKEVQVSDPGEDFGFISISGRVLDESSRKPLPYATISIMGSPVGITTNSDGIFTLQLSQENLDSQISVSHLGYRQQAVPVKLFMGNKLDILLETDYISIQEVMIRYYNPLDIVRSALTRIRKNYSNEPVYLVNFYREGVLKKNKFINYSEAIFKVYKSPFNRNSRADQVRLLKSRNISNVDRSDTLIVKIRAGIESSLGLDFVKNLPDFLNTEYINDYNFTNSGILSIEGKRAYEISFEQKENITLPLYRGVLYIETESLAFLGANFEVHPKYIDKARNNFITRKNRGYRASVEKAAYSVKYRYYNGQYHLNHVRADLSLSYRKKYRIFSNKYNVFVEMATSRIETENVERFERTEQLQTDKVFLDGDHAYDPDFWMGYSIIAPEEKITNSLLLIESEIESVIAGQQEE